MPRLLRFIAPLVLVALVELAFQAGIWEPLAKPASHAGTSVRLKRALEDPSVAHIDFVTLGSSRPEYGLDHAHIAAAARAHGYVHADLSMPGTHWMTAGILTRWLARHHPEIKGGIIALSIADLAFPGNGSYELGIVYPFHRLRDIAWMAAHVPFDRHDPETYGAYSALFGWREDIQDYVRHPAQRNQELAWWAKQPATRMLFDNPESSGDMCPFGLDTLDACARVDAAGTPQAQGLKRQCAELRGYAAQRGDFGSLSRQTPLPDFMQRTRDLVQAQLRGTPWPLPPVVVLMPLPKIWTRYALARGLHEWALSILRPLADSGHIRLIDATDFFNHGDDTDCRAFFDFYHQNALGRERFTDWLLPQIGAELYAHPAEGAPPGIAASSRPIAAAKH